MSGKVYGRAYPITRKDAKAYKRVNRALKANPIGVTAMASVNGRGAYRRSARAVAKGKTKSQRIQRAAEVYRNGNGAPMAGLKTKRRSVKRNAQGRFVAKAKTRTLSKKPKIARRVRKNKSVGYSKSYSAGYDKTFKKKSTSKRKAKRTTARKYKRVKLKDPSTGKTRLSYMYKSKGGKLKRIPTKALGIPKKRITSGRKKAAARIKKHGSAFVANKATGKKRVSAKRRRAGRRLAAYAAAKRQGKTVKAAKAIALRKVPLAKGDTFKGEAKAPVTVGAHKKRKTRVRRNKRKKTSLRRNGRKRKVSLVKNAKRRVKRAKAATTVRRKRRKSSAKKSTARKTVRRVKRRKSRRKASGGTSARKVTRRRKKKASAGTSKKVRRRKKATSGRRKKARKGTTRRRRKSSKKKALRRNGRRRSLRRNGRKGFFSAFRRNSFGANLKAIAVSGLFVFTGFMAHRVLTNLLVNKALATVDFKALNTWKKPIAGAGVFLVGQFVVGKVAPKRAIEIGAGMFASLVQSVIVTALTSSSSPNPELIATVSGYENSMAYSLRGTRRRRGVRGFERHAQSIGPRYTPVGQFSQAAAGWQQAAAGWEQAAAGTGEYYSASGTGEYFTATGEYFAPQGVKGVGAYEPAGQLAMQASAGVNTIIRDGIRPDSNLDRALDIAEAAAGLGEGPAVERRVGTQSQWIPNGPLWAGETAVTDTQRTSEVSAGILSRPGGNGILSAG